MRRLLHILQRLLAAAAVVWLLMLSLTSCTCSQRVRLLQRHCPECFQLDSLTLPDTLIVPQRIAVARLPIPQNDGLVPLTQQVDSGGLTLTLHWLADTVIVEAAAPPDTIVRKIPVIVPRPVAVPQCDGSCRRRWFWAGFAVAAALAFTIALTLLIASRR